ncbi:diiron oxygenase [Kitasatospora purpeofusca]|uniref:diiron oxygenase n=1 Tax=Kitasatospora purpeofusca TaxID=67352 RepID=UPI0036D261FB
MCGNAGLFIGCAALSYCPQALLTGPTDPVADAAPGSGAPPAAGSAPPQPPGADGQDGYRSPFGSWYERSAVRSTPRREIPAEHGNDRFFSADLVPVARHPLVQGLPRPVHDQVLIQHLYRYLDFTAKLETLVVNRTAVGIAQGSVGLPLPDAMRIDAYRIYCDEAYHALFSADLAQQVRQRTGIAPLLPAEPFFLRRLRALTADGRQDLAALVELLFVTVSETLISASLSEVPNDPMVVPAVSESIRDHAMDEGRHHAYFAAFLHHLWGSLDIRQRQRAALLVPDLIDAFLQPDREAVRAELAGYGLTTDESYQVVAEVFTDEVVAQHTAATARQTVRHFAGLGVLDVPEVQERFLASGLTC